MRYGANRPRPPPNVIREAEVTVRKQAGLPAPSAVIESAGRRSLPAGNDPRGGTMGLTAEDSGRLAAILDEHGDVLVKRWVEVVAGSVRGRLTDAELRRQVQDIHRALIDALRVRRLQPVRRRLRDPAGNPRRAVAHPRAPGLHRHRRPRSASSPSRRPSSPRWTWRTRTGRGCRTSSPPPGWSTTSGCSPSRAYAEDPRGADRRPGRAAAGAVHPGGQALGGRRRRPAGRHARLGPRPGGDGAAAADAGRHRLAVRDHRHHRRARRSTPRSPSTSSRPSSPPG